MLRPVRLHHARKQGGGSAHDVQATRTRRRTRTPDDPDAAMRPGSSGFRARAAVLRRRGPDSCHVIDQGYDHEQQGRPAHGVMTMPCLRCGTPIGRGTWCPAHTPAPRRPARPRGSTTQRGYGWKDHVVRARALRAERRDCCLCGEPIDYDAPKTSPRSFAAHHLTPDKAGPLDASHRVCNERAGPPRWG